MIESLGLVDRPAALLADMRATRPHACVSLSFVLEQDWLPGAPHLTLYAVCLLDADDLLCIVTDQDELLQDSIGILEIADRPSLDRLARELGATVINLREPLMLETVRVEKPWGAEIWYTAIEQRGVCRIGKTPLPWLMALAGELCCGAAISQLILLKILDPVPDEVYGDLYFEMHEEKIEVYVVTHVNESAWPHGAGGIRFGFDPDKLAKFVSLAGFKEAWLDSVNAYRDVRTKIDAQFDRFRPEEGFDNLDVVPPAVIERWKSRLDPALNAREQQCREEMEAFTAMHSIKPGDVIRVPPFTPHSLQHGVRVVEFQTPQYQRYILSFAQKVLTQDHWDTLEAMDKIDWQANFDSELTILESTAGCRVEQIADFDAFEVRRIRLEAGGQYRLELSTYAIAMAIDAPADVCGMRLAPEQACLLTALLPAIHMAPASEAGCFVLLAIPKSSG